MSNGEIAGLDWSADRLIPAFQPLQHLDVYDIRSASRAVQLTVTTLVGIVNRPQPSAYLITGDDDVFWLKQAFGTLPQTLSASTGDGVLEALLSSYRSSIQGLIIYDPGLVDTINIATMLAGQRNGIVVSPAQVYNLQSTYQLPVLVNLNAYRWTSRLQVYAWALHNLRCGASSRLVAGFAPNAVVGLRSFLVATCTFIYSLDSRAYLPDFSNGLLSERTLMRQILNSYPAGAVHLGWFRDESSGVRLTSKVGLLVLASDHFSNLEVWAATQTASPSLKNQVPQEVDGVPHATNKVYVSFTMSEGDNLQYCQHRMMHLWSDSARSELPIGWTFAPSLLHVAPAMADYYRSTATANDEFIAGPSGAGYTFPSRLPAQYLSTFFKRTGQMMQAMNMTTLEVLDTDWLESSGLPLLSKIRPTGMVFFDTDQQQRLVQGLRPFGLCGILSGAGKRKASWKMVDGVPFYQNLGLAGSVKKTVRLIQRAAAASSQRPLFLNVYILAWSMTPSKLKQVVEQLGHDYEVVLPRTLLAMLAETL